MARNQFGIDLAGTVYNAFRGAGGGIPVTLIKKATGAFDPADPLAPATQTETRHTGLCTISVGSRRVGNTLITFEGAFITVFSASMPGVVPEPEDMLEVDGETWQIKSVEIPGTAQVTFGCQCLR